MDMERIKQSLRLRSGRAKKTSKKFPTAPATQKPAPDQGKDLPRRPISQPQQQRTVSTNAEDDNPGLRNWDRDTALPQKEDRKQNDQQKPQTNGLSSYPLAARPKTAKRNDSTRYGRSGIERTQNRPQGPEDLSTLPQQSNRDMTSSDEADFDLKPPPSRPRPTPIDTLCEMLFSEGHLNIMLHDPQLMSRFSVFLQRYKPELSAVVLQYLQYQKAIKAIEYANAVAQSITPIPAIQEDEASALAHEAPEEPSEAAALSKPFAETSQRAYDLLVHEALPAYVTYTLVRLSTECLAAEITSHAPTSLTSNLIGGLSEVFCLSDPTLPDNPLIYCSEEFYRLTGYTSGDVLGQNCRFLQGPKTDEKSVSRLRDAVKAGESCTETVLNYRRDGRGFVNVLMIAPLEDDKGKVKYFLGAQVDVSRLVAGGWGLESLEKLVQKRELEEIRGRRVVKGKKDEALRKLRELSEMFDLEESAVVRSHSRSSSMDRAGIESGATSAGGSDRPKQARRVFGDDEEEGSDDEDDDDSDTETEAKTEKEKSAWKLATTGSSGKLPGLYHSYLLIRPAPSLRIIFVSPALRRKGQIMQKPFLSHLAAPTATLSGLKESFIAGTPVTAKVAFMAEPGASKDGTVTGRWRRRNSKGENDRSGGYNDKDPSVFGRTCWISATPLLGDDEEIGVWMVVLVDKSSAPSSTLSKTKGQGMKHQQLEGRALGIVKESERTDQIQMLSDDIRSDDTPIKPVKVGGTSANGTPTEPTTAPSEDRDAAREMYDKNGNEAVQEEAEKDTIHGDVTRDENIDGFAPQHGDQGEETDEFKKVPNKADGADDDDNDDPGPVEDEEGNGHFTLPSKEQDEKNTSPRKEAIQEVDDDDDDTFVQRRSQPVTPPSAKERVVIRSDPDSDNEREEDADTAANDSFPGKHEADEELTPTRVRHDHEHAEEHDLGGASGPGTLDSRAPLSMDYLRHPGTRQQRKNRSGGTPGDPDCDVWSPYSVD